MIAHGLLLRRESLKATQTHLHDTFLAQCARATHVQADSAAFGSFQNLQHDNLASTKRDPQQHGVLAPKDVHNALLGDSPRQGRGEGVGSGRESFVRGVKAFVFIHKTTVIQLHPTPLSNLLNFC